ncbi:MAG: hypothetical protein EOP09_05475 [Proteobacteria bacterium]|nr:MAG: hypothetical protein EOP09_05475 [Pseudomonadota bacterium]
MVNLHFILGSNPPPALLTALRSYVSSFPELTLSFASFSEWNLKCPEEMKSHTLVIFPISTKEEFLEAAPFLTSRMRVVSENRSKLIALNNLSHPSIMPLLRTHGCEEIFPFDVDHRLLSRRIRAIMDSQASEPVTQPKASTSEAQIIDLDALEDQYPDYWLIERSHAKRLMGKWLVEAQGPSSSEGEWKLVSTGPLASGDEIWEWQPRHSSSSFFNAKFKYRFVGQRPEFIWKTLRWHFVAKEVSLKLFDGAHPVEYRFASIGNLLSLRGNSPQARRLAPEIARTYSYGTSQSTNQSSASSHEPKVREEFINGSSMPPR